MVLRECGAASIAYFMRSMPVVIPGTFFFGWSSLALQVKRLRDIGLAVWLLPAWMLAAGAGQLLAPGNSSILEALALITMALLIGWPGKDADGSPSHTGKLVKKA